jgi:hypothetical protein
MFFAHHQLEMLEYGATSETAARPLRANAKLPLVEHGLGIRAVAG